MYNQDEVDKFEQWQRDWKREGLEVRRGLTFGPASGPAFINGQWPTRTWFQKRLAKQRRASAVDLEGERR